MSTIFRAGRAQDQKISRGQLLLGPVGGKVLRNIGNVIVERDIQNETVDIVTPEDPRLARLATVTTKQNESLKITARSQNSLVSSIAYMAPVGEVWTQTAGTGTVTIPANAKDGDIFDFVDGSGKQVFGVIVSPEEIATSAIIVDPKGGAFEVLGDRTTPTQVDFTWGDVTAAQKMGVFRRLQNGELRFRARFRENNAFGRTTVHDWPILSIRASGGQKLADEGNEVQSITLDAMIEFDFAAYGQERGLAREID
ncbi:MULTISPECIES: hypothetical protein [unclassified Methylobacterium]|uniref:hypothetical protein n=1 Tax=unclassified Methylobacterium TaxID=2615210 RepID=UPI000CB6E5F5|nr:MULTISPECIES: hypothetical protein [unclassified Methylobacterium]PIU06633.1 MAG: hypothetical protein COT56_08870 [Methylobacterium sp. CG09_land_8_20_14_0_10_71_15]PIU11333.1 MAG: hypothetical protein COT28_20575 [Methylobacterium sp. CG08_land_8_20_14_0_20_71_15]